MNAAQNKYPVFEANQVLTNAHLNQVFDYLDEQDRLTRANFIGVGIVCGLEPKYNATLPGIQLSRGCGITSKGYLIQLSDDVALVSYKPYALPDDIAYETFMHSSGTPPKFGQYPLWEIFPVGEPDSIPLTNAFLTNKVVLLFLEMKKDGLRNCSPNNCDDRGEEVASIVRKLLIERTDLDKIIAISQGLDSGLSANDLFARFSTKTNLVDVRLPRFDVPASGLATSEDVLAGFLNVFKKINLAVLMGDALSAAYTAFKPLLEKEYSTDPFVGFKTSFGFLDTVPANSTQIRFLQYYYDFFDDLIKAYDEFRWAGIDLLCVCCPSEDLFPRHLMAGEVFPSANAVLYRNTFLPSPATCCSCEQESQALKMLFHRLVAMIASFTNTPPLPTQNKASNLDTQIKITPSKSGDIPFSLKSIPYYYVQGGTTPLYKLWDAEKTRHGRADHNLSYRADEYASAQFVKEPLHFDLEPFNFFRIEGHLGKNYASALQTLITLKNQNRLPIEIIALRTGVFDENMEVDLSKEECRFQDLETLYDALREELLCTLCEGVMHFYNFENPAEARAAGTPNLNLLKRCAPGFRFKANSVGAWYEKYLTQFQTLPYVDVDQNQLDGSDVLGVYCQLFTGTSGLDGKYFPHVVSIYYLSRLSEILPDSFDHLGFADFKNKYEDLISLVRYFRSETAKSVPAALEAFAPQEDLIDHFDHILFSCKYEAIHAIYIEFARRLKEVKQKQFLGFFLNNNPGIQHGAGTKKGGTFILVYHEDPAPVVRPFILDAVAVPNIPFTRESFVADAQTKTTSGVNVGDKMARNIPTKDEAVINLLEKIKTNRDLLKVNEIRTLFQMYTGYVPEMNISLAGETSELQKGISAAVNEMVNGTVIADFYLPYICCSDCSPIQYKLPSPPLGFTIKIGCTDSNGSALVTITPDGGTPPFTYQLDAQTALPLAGQVPLNAGSHSILIRDNEGTESSPQNINIPSPLAIGQEDIISTSPSTWRVIFPISGGTPPYKVTGGTGTIDGDDFESSVFPAGTSVKIEIVDSVGCPVSKEFRHDAEPPCTLPCDGIARRCGFRFWLPVPNPDSPYIEHQSGAVEFSFEFPKGKTFTIVNEVTNIIQASPNQLNRNFEAVVNKWLQGINDKIESLTESKDSLRLSYAQSDKDAYGTLFIEYFECLDFKLIIRPFYSKSGDHRFDYLYTSEGTTITNLATDNVDKGFIPAFNCIEIQKCNPLRPERKLFKDANSKIEIAKKVDKNRITTGFKVVDGDKPIFIVWEMEDANPSMSNEENPVFIIENNKKKVLNLRLTVFTKNGGMLSIDDNVKMTNIDPVIDIVTPIVRVNKTTKPQPKSNPKPKTDIKSGTKVKPKKDIKPSVKAKPKATKSVRSIKVVKSPAKGKGKPARPK
ncbi:MAG: SprB repeat-containing protein [Saprospiraceae bacterium]